MGCTLDALTISALSAGCQFPTRQFSYLWCWARHATNFSVCEPLGLAFAFQHINPFPKAGRAGELFGKGRTTQPSTAFGRPVSKLEVPPVRLIVSICQSSATSLCHIRCSANAIAVLTESGSRLKRNQSLLDSAENPCLPCCIRFTLLHLPPLLHPLALAAPAATVSAERPALREANAGRQWIG